MKNHTKNVKGLDDYNAKELCSIIGLIYARLQTNMPFMYDAIYMHVVSFIHEYFHAIAQGTIKCPITLTQEAKQWISAINQHYRLQDDRKCLMTLAEKEWADAVGEGKDTKVFQGGSENFFLFMNHRSAIVLVKNDTLCIAEGGTDDGAIAAILNENEELKTSLAKKFRRINILCERMDFTAVEHVKAQGLFLSQILPLLEKESESEFKEEDKLW